MKASELRINNLVYGVDEDFNKSPVEISVDDLCDMQCSQDYEDDYEPIPLTSEWFEKCGGRIGGEQVLFISMPKIKAELHFEMKPYGNVVVLKSDFGEFVPEDIKYVHQLQNLYFALTGEELTIKEAKE